MVRFFLLFGLALVAYSVGDRVPATSGSSVAFPVRTGALCADGSRSTETGRGACSWHGGVTQWTYANGTIRIPGKPAQGENPIFIYLGHLFLISSFVSIYVNGRRKPVLRNGYETPTDTTRTLQTQHLEPAAPPHGSNTSNTQASIVCPKCGGKTIPDSYSYYVKCTVHGCEALSMTELGRTRLGL